jgi:hypothetical protein
MMNRIAQLLALALTFSLLACSKNTANGGSTQSAESAQSASQPNRAENEAAAASSVRTVNTAEVVYATTFPAQGYAGSLAVLGPGSPPSCSEGKNPDATHACLLDSALGCPSSWCVKRGYQFAIVSSSETAPIPDYTITATPINAANGRRNYCSNADAVIRFEIGAPRYTPITKQDCERWPPIY